MSVENLLNNLTKVKATGPGKWVACCPAHEDRSPSLAIKDDGGHVLIHCFGGCSVGDIMGAMGLPISDLFPPSDGKWKPDEKPKFFGTAKFTAIDALRCLWGEGVVMALLASQMADGQVLDASERDRLATACGRVATAMEYLEAQ